MTFLHQGSAREKKTKRISKVLFTEETLFHIGRHHVADPSVLSKRRFPQDV
jgi:hypothetical protein